MADLGFGLGVLLAMAGPLLILPAVWLLQRLLRPLVRSLARERLACGAQRAVAWSGATVLLATALAATYFPGLAEYRRLCDAYATPEIRARVNVAGFFRERLFGYQVAPLLAQGFAWIETEDPQRPGRLLRYLPDPRQGYRVEEVDRLRSTHGARESFVRHAHGILRTEKQVYERSDGTLLGRAGEVVFDGGALALFLGAYAVTSCPDVRTPQGSAAFGVYYELERELLGGNPAGGGG